MTASRTREYVLELDLDSDPISGRLRDDAGEALDFTGWLGLASALERMVAAAGADSEGEPATPVRGES